jgi:hypothetical protein
MKLLSPGGEQQTKLIAISIGQLIWTILLMVAVTVLFA